MVTRKPLESTWHALMAITLGPAVDRLPSAAFAERRDISARHGLVCRIHGEFAEMPGLSLTVNQAARLFGLPPDITTRILDRLAGAHLLRQTNGQFALP